MELLTSSLLNAFLLLLFSAFLCFLVSFLNVTFDPSAAGQLLLTRDL